MNEQKRTDYQRNKRKSVRVVLVHGTFARNAPWTQPGSKLRKALSRIQGLEVCFSVPVWSGKNTPAARSNGGKTILRTLRDCPEHQLVLIGHSHGGNAILSMLDSYPVHDRISAVVFLNTPFLLQCQEKSSIVLAILTAIFSTYSMMILGMFLSAFIISFSFLTYLALVSFLQLGLNEYGIAVIGPLCAIFGFPIAVYLCLLSLRRLWAFLQKLQDEFLGIRPKDASGVGSLDDVHLSRTNALIISVEKDEAYAALSPIDKLSRGLNMLPNWLVAICAMLIGLLGSALVIYISSDTYSMVLESLFSVLFYAIWINIFCLPIFLLIQFLVRPMRGAAFGDFGFVDQQVAKKLDRKFRTTEFFGYSVEGGRGFAWRHSSAYEYTECINKICDFIECSSASHQPDLPSRNQLCPCYSGKKFKYCCGDSYSS